MAVDFDSTLCFSKWPEFGEPNRPLIEYLKVWRNQGNKFILWTCRAGEALEKAISWCQDQQFEFWYRIIDLSFYLLYGASLIGKFSYSSAIGYIISKIRKSLIEINIIYSLIPLQYFLCGKAPVQPSPNHL